MTILVKLPETEFTPVAPDPAVALKVPVSLLFAFAVITTVPADPIKFPTPDLT